MALTKAKSDATDQRLAAMTLPDGGGWALEARQAALARVGKMGLPSRRDEYWKYTDPATLVQPDPPRTERFVADETEIFADMRRLKIVFRDGVLDEAASDALALDGVRIERLADVLATDIHWARDLYGVLEARGQDPVDRSLAALNTAFARDGIVLHATATPDRPVSIVYLHEAADSDAMLHHLVRVEPGVELTVLENGPAAARFNMCMEADLAAGGSLHHVRTQGRDHDRRCASHIFTRVAESATVKSFTLTVNGALTRNEHVVEFTGDHAVAHVAGAAVGDGATAPFHHDDTVFVTHDAVGCESRQVFKKVLRNGAEGVFQGKILVKEGAQKTDGYQISQGLLLDDDSTFQAKPELEIYADDVACSHGSTTGAIDEDSLFYLRARGIDRTEATDLLALAFLAEAIGEIDDDSLQEVILQRLGEWLARRRAG